MNTKPTILAILLLVISSVGWTQTAEELYNQSITELNNKNYEKGIELMDQFITTFPDFENIHMIYLNRASAKALLNDTDGAILDYTTAFELNPEYAEALRQRGYLKKETGDYAGALEDYDQALTVNPKFAMVYVNKAVVMDSLKQPEEACKNYEKAFELGITDLAGLLYHSCDSNSIVLQKYFYKILVDKTTDETYGYTLENPIKVGHGPRGQREYLAMLRDGKGNQVKFQRIGNAGMYQSENGLMGVASVDSYSVKYKNEKGKKKKTTLYLSFYDYESPKIPVGFYSTEDFKP